MKTVIAAALAASMLATATAGATPSASTSGHDSGGAQVYTLDEKVGKLLPGLANQGMRKRLSDKGFEFTSYRSKCTRRSRIKLQCRYKFTHKVGDAFGTGPSCGTATAKLVRQGKALSVGPTPAKSCS